MNDKQSGEHRLGQDDREDERWHFIVADIFFDISISSQISKIAICVPILLEGELNSWVGAECGVFREIQKCRA